MFYLEDLHITFIVLDYLLCFDFFPAHIFDDQVLGGEECGHEALDMFYELLVNLLDVSFKLGVGGHVTTGVRQKEIGHLGEARRQSFPESLQFWVHSIVYRQTLLEDVVSALQTVGLLVGILPVPDQELQLLERDLTGVLQSQSAVLGEVMKVLEVVLLDVVEEVVHQHRARHEGEGEDGGTVSDSAAERQKLDTGERKQDGRITETSVSCETQFTLSRNQIECIPTFLQ